MREIDEGYALRAPGGQLIAETFDLSKNACWDRAYRFLGRTYEGWHERYFKKWEASQAWARKNNWRMVKVKLQRAPVEAARPAARRTRSRS
jgi:hypothetical protein